MHKVAVIAAFTFSAIMFSYSLQNICENSFIMGTIGCWPPS